MTIDKAIEAIKNSMDKFQELSVKYDGTEHYLKYQYKYSALRDIYNEITEYKYAEWPDH